ncbi:MAG TPA: tandem-95 repeat protein [Chryseolinea sp.]|nr:tandem-95 repeat protein [Chryseolinea sp.]
MAYFCKVFFIDVCGMKPSPLLIGTIIILTVSSNSFAQLNFFRPEIVGQTPSPLRTLVNTPVTIELTNLIVTDGDAWQVYPNGYTLQVRDDRNYTVNDATVTPEWNFTGTLKVPVRVNDGAQYSRSFDLRIEVSEYNEPPQITGQEQLATNEDNPFVLKLSDVRVNDPDNDYPQDFSLTINSGPNYSISGLTITPAQNFAGVLSIPITVNDGQSDSQPFNLQLKVNPVNDVPIIKGQVAIGTLQGTSVPILLTHLTVTDPDNRYPDNFSLTIYPGDRYTSTGNSVKPFPDFFGVLTVNVTVYDGVSESPVYPLKITVTEVKNIVPVITGQKQKISIVENTQLAILLSHLNVTDPDNKYPSDFTLKVYPGDNYAVNTTTITPIPSFKKGVLSVRVTVNDGKAESAVFLLQVEVTPINVTPKIIGQKELTMLEDSTLTITLTDLTVSDADNAGYPKGFSLIMLPPGKTDRYTLKGATVRPWLNVNNFIEVGIKVSDGKNISDEFRLSILITPVNDPPEIIAFDTTRLKYEPDTDPINVLETIDLQDVDNENLSMAEIGFRLPHYSPDNDALVMTSDSTNIKAIYDPAGVLFLVGNAPLEEYKTAIRSIKYGYQLIRDENGNYLEFANGDRILYINLNDGQLVSETRERKIVIETDVVLDIPNTFTPNGDKSNDTWYIRATNTNKLDKAVLRVYNKRGLLLYESKGVKMEWDGVSAGQVLPVDTYYYTIDLNLSYVRKTYKGFVTILH